MYIGTMAPKNDYLKKNTNKKLTPKVKLHFTDEEASDLSRYLVKFPMKKPVSPKENTLKERK